jgi:hypothetical protein
MTKNPSADFGAWWMIILVAVALAALGNLFTNNNSAPATRPSAGGNTAEHRYVHERFRQEGYSNSEAQQAADAIIKFHNAQQNR